jgi:hypothetical protein
MQQRLKPKARPTWTWIIPTKLFEQLFAPVHYAISALDLGFRRVALPPFARYLKTSVGRGGSYMYAWHTSKKYTPKAGASEF